MADDDQDESQKTEEPTHRRLEEAFKKGQVPFSREVTSFMMLLAFTIALLWIAPYAMRNATLYLSSYIEHSYSIPVDPDSIRPLALYMLVGTGSIIAIPILLTLVAAFAGALMQNGIVTSSEPLIPKLEKISPLKGLKRMFSLKSFIELLKGVVKVTLIGVIAYIAIFPHLGTLEILHTYSMAGLLAFIWELAKRIMIGVACLMLFVALADFIYQRFEHRKSLRMSKHDLKEEFKQSEGNPEVKAKLRRLRAERAQKRMMAAVPTADVIITNPTHFALALKYDVKVMKAPMCVAKGQDHVALKIREVAKEHKIPIVENPPLARALFESVEIDQEIPVKHYQAVAEIIGYVYKLKGKIPR
ncbi:MAG: flhB [Rickettsiales bacterium]|jgi:flagellar biosynthetic protein FlhB|nr:flhB [Rickettsiales bacterium]